MRAQINDVLCEQARLGRRFVLVLEDAQLLVDWDRSGSLRAVEQFRSPQLQFFNVFLDEDLVCLAHVCLEMIASAQMQRGLLQLRESVAPHSCEKVVEPQHWLLQAEHSVLDEGSRPHRDPMQLVVQIRSFLLQ